MLYILPKISSSNKIHWLHFTKHGSAATDPPVWLQWQEMMTAYCAELGSTRSKSLAILLPENDLSCKSRPKLEADDPFLAPFKPTDFHGVAGLKMKECCSPDLQIQMVRDRYDCHFQNAYICSKLLQFHNSVNEHLVTNLE